MTHRSYGRRPDRNACSSSPKARRTCCSRAARRNLSAKSRDALSDERRAEILQANEELAGQALRTLGVAARELPADALQHEDADEGARAGTDVPGPDRHD